MVNAHAGRTHATAAGGAHWQPCLDGTRRGSGTVSVVVGGAMDSAFRFRGLLWLCAVAFLSGVVLHAWQSGHPPVHELAPVFTLTDLQGQAVSLGAFRGEDVVLRFSSLGCTPCRADWAELRQWETTAPGVTVLAVEVGQSLGTVRSEMGYEDPTVPVVVDSSGRVAQEYGVRTIPSLAFINKQGVLVSLEVVGTSTGLWPQATWLHYDGLLQKANG